MSHEPEVSAVSNAYRDFAPYVRRRLHQLGVRDADLPDQCHEVFVVLHKRSERLDEIGRVDLWLREVCRRVAASYRRRGYARREIISQAPTDAEAEGDSGDPESSLVRADDEVLLRTALERLDDDSRELLALHDVGELPLTELAKLVEHDRRTVQKRLESARRRLSILLRHGDALAAADDDAARASLEAENDRTSKPPTALGPSDELEVITVTRGVTVGLLGNVVLSVWPGNVELEAIETLATVGPLLIERCGGRVAYLATVESNIRPPARPARKRIVSSLDAMGSHVLAYATAMLGKTAWIVRPIMSGLLVLSRPRFPMQFMTSVDGAARWLCHYPVLKPSGPVTAAALTNAVERLRHIARKPD